MRPLKEGILQSTNTPKSGKKMDIQQLYNIFVCSSDLNSRLNAGHNGILHLSDTGWLAKTDRPGSLPLVEHEYRIYELLEAEGLTGDIVPHCRFEEGWEPLIISRINDCASFGEYFEQILLGNMTESLWLNLCTEIGATIRRFHDAGFIHNDLHGGNIVLELREGMWKPFLIDFGHCGHESLQNPFLTPEALERGLENDVDDLVEVIRLPLVGIPQPPWVEKGIELLKTVSVL
jgi:serine/threonine protein kinase